jgi:hypothetical protein
MPLSEDKAVVARQLDEAQRSLSAFTYRRRQYPPSRAIERTITDAEHAFSEGNYTHASHLCEVVACMVRREAPRFASDPTRWIARQQLANNEFDFEEA